MTIDHEAVTVHIRDNLTGEVRSQPDTISLEDGEPFVFGWEDGNFACDCNRSMFFAWAAGVNTDDEPDDARPCGDDRFSVNIESPARGVFYREFDTIDAPPEGVSRCK